MEKLFKKYKKLKKYWAEITLLLAAFLITVVSLIVLKVNNQPKNKEDIITSQIESSDSLLPNIYIDVSGEVIKPDVYKIKSGTRLKEIMNLAGGLSKNADEGFFNRNYNLSRILVDQEKIYIPSSWEVANGYFVENKQTLDFITAVEKAKPDIGLININSASVEELDTLPGIGQITAEKIISGRTYQSVDELLTKKVVNKGVFEQIKNLISI